MAEVAEAGTQTSVTPEERLVAFFAGNPAPKAAPEPVADEPADQPEPQAQSPTSDEPTVDDLEASEPQADAPDADEFEITFNGEPIKLTKEEARERAQLGELYRRNEDGAKARWQQAEQLVQQASQMAQLAPEVQQAVAMAKLYEQALQQFDPQAMRKLAAEDPAAYLEKRAEYDTIAQQAQQAQQAAHAAFSQFKQQQETFRQAQLAQEFEMLPKLVPQWRDQARAVKERNELAQALQANKLRPQTIDAIAGNAELLALAYKAHRYDALQAGKREKLEQVSKAPAALKPGAAQAPGAEKTERFQKARSKLSKSGSADDFAAALLARGFK